MVKSPVPCGQQAQEIVRSSQMAQLKTSPDGIRIACFDQLQEFLSFFISTNLTLEERPFGKRVGLDFGKDALKSQAIYKIG